MIDNQKITSIVKPQKKVKFVGFQSGGFVNGVKLEKTWLYKTLAKHFDLVVCDDADYIICSCFDLYGYCSYGKEVRIFFSCENYVPDFNLVDYAISSYPIDFFDRNFYLPASFFGYDGERKVIENRKDCFDKETLNEKTKFANLIASYDSEENYRSRLFHALSKYKYVDSPGKFLKNCEQQVWFQDNSKIEFQKQCKFSICVESAINKGFNTEKIMDAFYAGTIPIYYGDPEIVRLFNPKAFINVADFASIEEVVNKVIEIDNNDELYLKMINQPIFNEENVISNVFQQAEAYLLHIFNQSLDKAVRRSKVYWPKGYEEFLIKPSKNILPKKQTQNL